MYCKIKKTRSILKQISQGPYMESDKTTRELESLEYRVWPTSGHSISFEKTAAIYI